MMERLIFICCLVREIYMYINWSLEKSTDISNGFPIYWRYDIAVDRTKFRFRSIKYRQIFTGD